MLPNVDTPRLFKCSKKARSTLLAAPTLEAHSPYGVEALPMAAGSSVPSGRSLNTRGLRVGSVGRAMDGPRPAIMALAFDVHQ